MTVQIGSITDVPAPGDPIRSPWAQTVSGMVIHRFASRAALDSQWTSPPDGAAAYLQDVDWTMIRANGAWRLVNPSELSWQASGLGGSIPLAETIVAVVSTGALAFPYRARYEYNTVIVAPVGGTLKIRYNTTGSGAAVTDTVLHQQQWTNVGTRDAICITGSLARTAGGPLALSVWVIAGAAGSSVTGDASYDRLEVRAVPI